MTNVSRYPLLLVIVTCSLFSVYSARASHLVGSDFTYVLLDSSGGTYHYRVSLTLYADCLHGQPEAIAQDNPAFLAVYSGSGSLVHSDSVSFSSESVMPVTLSGPCGGGIPDSICVLKKVFVKEYYLPACISGYTVVYQRCCKNASLTNVIAPGDHGSTYSCTIPPSGTTTHNNSAVFTYYPPLVVALNAPVSIDFSATDADGDSLSYELCTANEGASDAVIKPIPPSPPPFTPVAYTAPLSYANPMYCSVALAVDPVTGILTGTPNIIGTYLVTVCCHEWRSGVIVNTVKREFEFSVRALTGTYYHPYAGEDTSIYVGDSVAFSASGAVSYSWSPSTYLTDATIYNPVGHFPDPGFFTYILYGISDSGCTGYDTITVNVLEHAMMVAPNAFTPNGDGVNDVFEPIAVKNSTLKSLKIYNNKFELIYSSTASNARWDGKYKGVTQNVGSYYWEIVYDDNSGKTRSTKGSVTLIR